MKKFEVTATLVVTSTLSKEIEAEDLKDATKKALDSVNKSDWKVKSEFKTNAR